MLYRELVLKGIIIIILLKAFVLLVFFICAFVLPIAFINA